MKIYFRSVRDSFKTAPWLWTLMALMAAVSFLSSLVSLALSWVVDAAQVCINTGVGVERLWQSMTIFCVLFAITSSWNVAAGTIDQLIINKSTRAFERRLFEKMRVIDQIELEKPESLNSYKLAATAAFDQRSDTKNAMTGVFMISLLLLSDIVATGGNVAILVSFSPKLLIFAVLSTPLSMVISVISERLRIKLYRSQAQKARETEYFWELFCRKESVKEMRVFGAQRFFRNKWRAARDEMLDDEVRLNSRLMLFSNIGDIVKNAFYALNVALALALVIRGEITIAGFTACIGVFANLQITLVSFMYSLEYFSECLHRSEDYYRFLDLGESHEGKRDCGEFHDAIELKNVSFRYPAADTDALKGIDLKINKGDHIVIVGENGSGKTTLSKILTACYAPSSGSVAMDGTDIYEFKKDEYLKNMAVVSQNFVRYNMTLRENIGISEPESMGDDKRISNAARLADVEDISRTIGGYDADLGREFGGAELSGGQWQKVAIARAVFRDAPVVILDEPTAALDPLTEYEILTDFMRLSRDRTSVIISHRIGICTAADRVIVMSGGRIVETGTHDELVGADGEYARMWNAQAQRMM